MAHQDKNYSPPGYVITHFDKTVKLELEQAQKFNDFRVRLCATLGQDNEICDPTNLWRKALDLVLPI